MLSTQNGASIIRGSTNKRQRFNKNGVLVMAKVKIIMTRNAVSKGKPEPKGKVLEFDKEDTEWLNLIHANAAKFYNEPAKKVKK